MERDHDRYSQSGRSMRRRLMKFYLNDYQNKLCLNSSVISDSISSNSKESKERIEVQVGSSARDVEENYNLTITYMIEIDCLKKKYEISKFAYEKALELKEKEEANEIIDLKLSRKNWRELILWYKRFMENECHKLPDWINVIENNIK